MLVAYAIVLFTAVRSHAHIAFYHAHRLAGPGYFLAIAIHGLGGVVRGQSAASLLVHNATYCAGRVHGVGS
ncbi:unnamed protein product [Lampetra fluviatilis]